MMKLCYIPKGINLQTDCYVSSIVTPDHILKEYPRTVFGIMENDPLRDDAFSYANRMIKNNCKINIIFARGFRHGILSLFNSKDFPEGVRYFNETIKIMQKFLLLKDKEKSSVDIVDNTENANNTISDLKNINELIEQYKKENDDRL